LETCIEIWKTAKPPTSHSRCSSLLEAIRATKPLFYEQKSQQPLSTTGPAATDSLLASYTAAITSPSTPHKGALLLSVLSGSLSEGINFSDTLGRCVLVFGLPFANPHSATTKAKLAHVSSRTTSLALAAGKTQSEAERDGKKAASEFYLNGTMRAVNQAVGRAIRHKGDYAAIVLVDRRFCGERVREKLPGWMKESIVSANGVQDVVKDLTRFFERKRIESGG